MTIKITKSQKDAKRNSVARDKFKRLNALPADKKAAIDNMFYEGVSVARISSTIREGWGLFTDIKETTLTKFLFRYKWDVIDKNIAVRAEVMDTPNKRTILQKASADIDVIEEIGQLVSVQKTRVKKLLDREKDMPMLFNQLGGEMKTLAGFVQQYADLSFELGTLKRSPKITKVTNDADGMTIESEGKAEVMFSIEASQKMEDAANTFFEALRTIEGEVTPVLDDE